MCIRKGTSELNQKHSDACSWRVGQISIDGQGRVPQVSTLRPGTAQVSTGGYSDIPPSLYAKSQKRVSRILGLGNAVRASTVDHAQTDRRTVADSKGTNIFTASLFTRLGGRRTLAVRQFSLCGWEAASSQGRQAHWRGKLAALDRSFRVPTDESR
jgi:hypothetical protein